MIFQRNSNLHQVNISPFPRSDRASKPEFHLAPSSPNVATYIIPIDHFTCHPQAPFEVNNLLDLVRDPHQNLLGDL
jgi:hypothetical protein